jgi:GYF domain 2
MKYYIQRQNNEYGPYTLADLQRYVAQGNILLTDLTRSEGMTEWVPVSQVIGNIPIPVTAPAMQNPAMNYGGAPAYATATVPAYGAPAYGTPAMPGQVVAGPVPVDFHWGAVLAISPFTCFLFWWAWFIVEAAFVRKINSESRALLFVILAFISFFVGRIIMAVEMATHFGQSSYYGAPFFLIGILLYVVAEFQMKSDLEDYYTTVEPINLQLNPFMTFFFSIFYFQHHLSRIAKWKKTGYLQPQGS